METRNCTLDADFCKRNPGAVPGEYVELAVSDTGEGITLEQQQHIFDPFFTTKDTGKGTGLGLAMVYSFVKRSGGYVKVYSELDIGTTFTLYLPRSQHEDQRRQTTDEEAASLPRGTETLLVVDDEIELLEVAKTQLEGLGYRVLTASNGEQALERLAEEPSVALLFSDVVMPGGMNGYELAEQATAAYPGLKVLLTSGYTEKAVADNGQARFAANLLSKPYSYDELAQLVRALLGENAQSETEFDDRVPSVGIDGLDKDHEVLLALLNHSRLAAANGDDEQGAVIVDQLLNYTQTHFRREEEVMAVCNYPGLANHRKVHRLLARQVDAMQPRLNRGELRIDELATFLRDWLVEHIHGMDMAFESHCEGKDDLTEQALEQAGPGSAYTADV